MMHNSLFERLPRLGELFIGIVLSASLLAPARGEDNYISMDLEPLPPAWSADPSVHMIAIEALVIEITEDKARDINFHIHANRTDPANNLAGADFNFGPSIEPGKVPTLTATATGFETREVGLGFDLTGLDMNSAIASAEFRALVDEGEARIVTRPVILALHGTPAEIHVGSRIPYQDISDKGSAVTAEKSIGVLMKVVPQILDLNRQLIKVDVQDISVTTLAQVLQDDNVDRPVFNTSQTITNTSLNSGESRQISSFKIRRNRVVREGIPLLMRLPVIGHFFSSRAEVIRDVDVMVFLTPTIVAPGQNVVVPYDFEHQEDLIEQGLRELSLTP